MQSPAINLRGAMEFKNDVTHLYGLKGSYNACSLSSISEVGVILFVLLIGVRPPVFREDKTDHRNEYSRPATLIIPFTCLDLSAILPVASTTPGWQPLDPHVVNGNGPICL